MIFLLLLRFFSFMQIIEYTPGGKCLSYKGTNSIRLLVVPFKIVAKAREIAERKRKTGRKITERKRKTGASLAALCALSSHALATI